MPNDRDDAATDAPQRDTDGHVPRRRFLQLVGGAALGIAGGLAYVGAGSASADEFEYRNHKPDRMAYRRLGRTNMMVSAVSMGGASNYGHGVWADHEPADYREMLEWLLDQGVNYFDTSTYDYNGSSGYETEDDFAALCTPDVRERVFVSTKIDHLGSTRESVEASLKRLGTDYVDLVYIHNGRGVEGDDYSVALACYDVLDDLRDEGKVRFTGMTAHTVAALEGLIERYPDRVDVIMGYYGPGSSWNPARWEALYTLAHSNDVGVVAMKVLMGAIESWEERRQGIEGDPEALGRLRAFRDAGATWPQACIQWALSNDGVHTALLGMRTMAEAQEDVAAVRPDGA